MTGFVMLWDYARQQTNEGRELINLWDISVPLSHTTLFFFAFLPQRKKEREKVAFYKLWLSKK